MTLDRASRLADRTGAAHREVRGFCLDVIKEVYGFDYRPDWHADLDSLLREPAANHFSRANRGGLWIAR